ncbi:hypothetical protein COE99_09570 [Bacillus toyonensis]|nr:hypothetical protein COE99_09570 [Bacillus toyonensis]
MTRYDMKAQLELKMLFFGLIGTILCGCISFLTTKYSLKKQFEEQEKNRIELNKKEQIVALKSVLNEMNFNNNPFGNFIRLMDDMKDESLRVKDREIMLNKSFKYSKWEKHSDTLDSMEHIEYIDELHTLYIQLMYDANSDVIVKATSF